MVRNSYLTLERINKRIKKNPNDLNLYGLKFSILIIKERYEELIECIDSVLVRHELSHQVLLELRREVVQKMDAQGKV